MPYLYHEINCLLKKEYEDVECPVSLESRYAMVSVHVKFVEYRFLFHLNSLYADKEDNSGKSFSNVLSFLVFVKHLVYVGHHTLVPQINVLLEC